jgi:predicted alpha/beta-fold hydrolase
VTSSDAADFRPSWLIRHAQIQSILATKSPRRRVWLRCGSTMEAVTQPQLLDAGDNVRLTGQHSRQPAGTTPKGLVVLIHGWEGSHDSAYLYSMACAAYAAGYNVFRLNLRDHGGSHHLNRELFHSARIREVIGAIRTVQTLDPASPLFVIGFSLGGNFALRVGMYGPAAGVRPRLSIGICPAINPAATARAIDDGPLLFRWYFMDKWRKTIAAKQRAFPDLKLDHLARPGKLYDITARFVAEHTEYDALDAYFQTYTLTPEQLHAAPSPLAIITAQDDPVVPFEDFRGLRETGALRHLLTPAHGGHCGFIENLGLSCWTERHVLRWLQDAA